MQILNVDIDNLGTVRIKFKQFFNKLEKEDKVRIVKIVTNEFLFLRNSDLDFKELRHRSERTSFFKKAVLNKGDI